MPEEGIQFEPHSEILTYEEMLRIVRLCVRHGIRKVRFTGGDTILKKPNDHGLALRRQYRKCVRPMNGIGG